MSRQQFSPSPAIDPPRFSEADFRARAARGLLAQPTDALFDPRTGKAFGRSDWDLDPELAADLAAMNPPRPAAVLVPVVLREELMVLLTQRTHTLSSHAGQIAFPGGRVDEADDDAAAAALREAQEEIGLDEHFVEALGFLDGYRTGTGYGITPLVALVRPDFTLSLAADEVEEAFEVPLSFLMTAANHQRHEREWRGRQRAYWAMPYEERYIWGATAGMLKNMYDRLYAS
jgi:8-oxo-dGTP pyrophosphatase MutT (NUDIX family)